MNKIFRMLTRRSKDVELYSGRGEEFKYWQRYIQDIQIKTKSVKRFKRFLGSKGRPHQSISKWIYNGDEPWTAESIDRNMPGFNSEKPRIGYGRPIKELNVFVGDFVMVLTGEDKGKLGVVSKVVPQRSWCFVEGLHKTIEEENPFENSLKAPIPKELSMPLALPDEVKLIDPSDLKPVDIEWRYTDTGEKVRVSVRTGRVIPIPLRHINTWEDSVDIRGYKGSDKDTALADLEAVTFTPKMSTFEEDICKAMNLKYEKRKERSYWY